MENLKLMLPDFKLETFFSKWEFNVKYHMCASDMETMSLRELLKLGTQEDRERWDNLTFKYIETFGTPELRYAITDTYKQLSPKNILVLNL